MPGMLAVEYLLRGPKALFALCWAARVPADACRPLHLRLKLLNGQTGSQQ